MPITLTQKNVRALNGALVRTYVAAIEGNLGDVVALDASGKVILAQGDAAASARAIGVVVSIATPALHSLTFAAGETVGVCVSGPITGFADMDETTNVWVSDVTAGEVVQSAPAGVGTFACSVGYPLGDDVLMVNPAPVVVSN
jgi:hypothetical protein